MPFTEFGEFSDKQFMTLKGLKPATQPPLATTAPVRHM